MSIEAIGLIRISATPLHVRLFKKAIAWGQWVAALALFSCVFYVMFRYLPPPPRFPRNSYALIMILTACVAANNIIATARSASYAARCAGRRIGMLFICGVVVALFFNGML